MKRRLLSIALILSAALTLWACAPDLPRAPLEAKYFAGASEYVEVAGVRAHVRDTGPRDAPAVLMLHGMGSSLHTWEAWADDLSDRFRVVRLDLPGYGLTGPDPGGDYSMDRTMAVLTGLMDRLEIRRTAVVGNSMGGRFAWNLAARHPERVTRLVLVSPDGFAMPGFDYGAPPKVPLVAQAMRWVLPRTVVRLSLEPAYADPERMPPGTLDRYYDLLRAPGVRQAILDQAAQLRLERPEPILATIHKPVLLLWGAEDAFIPAEHAQDYLAALPDARLVTLPGIGHLPQEEAPDASLPPVRAFLEGPAAQASR